MKIVTYEKLLDILRTDKNPGGKMRVLALIKTKVEPQIKSMSKPELVKEFAKAIYAMYQMEVELYLSEDSIEHSFRDRLRWNLAAARFKEDLKKAPKKARQETARKGGQARAAKDERTFALDEIEKDALKVKEKFEKRGYTKLFVDAMLEKHPIFEDKKTIEKRLTKLKNEKLITRYQRKKQ